MNRVLSLLRNNYRTLFSVSVLLLVFFFSIQKSYLLFHTIIELFSIVVAFAVFIVTWNSRKMLDNNYLFFVGIAYLAIAALDLLHTLTFKGMNVISGDAFYANQFWVATRLLEALTFVAGFLFISKQKKLNADIVFLFYFLLTVLISFSILVWRIFPVCYIEGVGQTPFKVYAEYGIICILLVAGYLLWKNRDSFSTSVYRLLIASLIFTILSEFCFTLYVSNYSTSNELGHYAKLIAFFLIYKANVETGFVEPTGSIFKNLKDNEEKYRTLAENLPGLIMRFSPDLDCIYTNGEKEIAAVISDDIHSALLETRLTLQMQENTVQVTNSKGISAHYVILTIPEHHTGREEQTYLVICQDITKLKVAEQQLQELNDTKDKLFSIIAHDLKNPFTALLSFSELIHKNTGKLSNEKIAQMALRMNESAKQAYTLLENLLSWSRIQTGILKASARPVQVTELLEMAKRFAEPLAQTKHINLVIEDNEDLTISTDEQMIGTVLRNLVGNAIKFSYPGSDILLKATQKGQQLIIAVTDSGVGIEQDVLPGLLLSGSRRSTTGTASEKGTGLGLILCREFVELNNGKLWVESEFGLGTTFYFSLPFSK